MFQSLFSSLRTPAAAAIFFIAVASPEIRADTTRLVERLFPATQVSSIAIETISSPLQLVKAAGSEVEVEATLRANTDRPSRAQELFENVQLSIEMRGDELFIKVEAKKERRFWGLFGSRSKRAADVQIRVSVPSDLRIEVKGVSGDVQIDGIRGDHRLRSVSGDILIREGSGNVVVDSVSGAVRLENFLGAHRVETVSGDIRASLSESLARDSRFTSVSGDIHMLAPPSLATQFSVATVSGDLRLDLEPDRVTHRSGRRVEAVLGDGGPRLAVKTVSGDVRLAPEPSAH